MSHFSLLQILDKLAEHVEMEEAEELLGIALDALDLPVREQYTRSEVMAIGAAVADSQRPLLAQSDEPLARSLEAAVAPIIDALKADQLHLQPDAEGIVDEEDENPSPPAPWEEK